MLKKFVGKGFRDSCWQFLCFK